MHHLPLLIFYSNIFTLRPPVNLRYKGTDFPILLVWLNNVSLQRQHEWISLNQPYNLSLFYTEHFVFRFSLSFARNDLEFSRVNGSTTILTQHRTGLKKKKLYNTYTCRTSIKPKLIDASALSRLFARVHCHVSMQ